MLLAYRHLYEFAWLAFMLIVLLAWDYIRQGTLVVAARQFHHKEYDKAERTLMEILSPRWLSKNRRGYYEFLMGGICLQRQDFAEAEQHYEIAAQYPLRSVNDHVAALVHVANISIRRGNFDKAEAYIELTEKHNESINAKMKEVIGRLKQEIKTHEL
jgi:tetratricopeptide (TPR) repeat protein